MGNAELNAIAKDNQTALKDSKSIKKILLGTLKGNMRQYTMILALLVIWAFFTIVTDGIFISSRNLSNLFLQCAATAIAACGMVLVMVAGHIDLSVGSFVGLTGAVAAQLMVKGGFGTIETIAITLAIGLLLGLFQGFWISYGKVPAFIVTLAGFLAFRGGVIAITGGNSIAPMNDSFKIIGQGYLPKINANLPFNDTSALVGVAFIICYLVFELVKRHSRIKYGFEVLPVPLLIAKMVLFSTIIALGIGIMASYMGIPYAILLLIAIIVIFTVIAEKTTFGRHVYAIGGNKEAARLSGININRVNLGIFVLMGLLSTIAGIVYTARLNAATGSAGTNMEMDAIASAVIGGTSTLGGAGTIAGCIIGALVMGSLDNGMSLMNADVAAQYVVKGLILLLAVWFDIKFSKRA
ncbi:xylose transport system permease protein XylH [Ruminiclostridium hungatei]|uniref:Xylose transport system permease protein XylH n=1 Tax=Ruminiclostridium hungatei TaxID=48256 RepID=A0A1V4SQJ0_RUMHU|nr:sugar ABC transporter permease [Ruminiclostridium hungatei]OPX45726.1 xylose transport system permease protein XylH [Ruminiclostridium hungatei]